MKLPLLSKQKVNDLRVLVRVAFDVPTDRRGTVEDTFRLERGLPTVRWLLRHGAKIILLGHRGQPHGKYSRAHSLQPVGKFFSKIVGRPVGFTARPPKALVGRTRRMRKGEILLLENLRFDLREEKNNRSFACELAELGDRYVNDDFATSHRAHASLVRLPTMLPSAAGLNVSEEVVMLERLLHHVRRPFYVVLGGAKVHDKLGVVTNLLRRVDGILVGGASASTLLHAKGFVVGHSLVDHNAKTRELRPLLASRKMFLPSDVRVAQTASAKQTRVVPVGEIAPTLAAFDVGPKTAQRYASLLRSAKTVFWAGSIGLTEQRRFCRATKEIAGSISRSRVFAVAGGGDTIRAFHDLGLARRFSFLSTGGGATLMFLAGKPLPALDALQT